MAVIEEWRQAVGRVNYGLPAGCLEPYDDDPATAVDREIAEETGYEPGSVEHLMTVEPANGFSHTVFHYYLATECTPTADRDLDDNESTAVETTTFDVIVETAREDEL